MNNLPIPPTTSEVKARLAELAHACATATAAGDNQTLAILESEINTIVYRLFDLSPAEIDLIESSGVACF